MTTALREDGPGVVARGLIKLTLPSLFIEAYAALMEEMLDEETLPIRRKDIDNRIKDTNWVFPWMLPNGEWVQMKIPMPPGFGVLFGGWVHRFTDQLRNDNPRAWNEYMANVWWDFTNAVPIPAAVEPMVEHWANRDTYSGGKWTPARLEKASGDHQYQPWTTETAKTIAGWINAAGGDVSGITIEGYVGGWGGGLGMEILKKLDLGAEMVGLAKRIPQAKDFADSPWVGSFFVRNPGMSPQVIDDFYDEFEKFDEAKANVRILEKRGDMDGLEKALEDPILAVDLAPYSEALADMRAAAYAIMESKFEDETNPDGSPLTSEQIRTEKRQLLDDIFADMHREASDALEELDNYRAELAEDNADN